jgi:RNA polymerase sigma-70 factor (ECF subfamily)
VDDVVAARPSSDDDGPLLDALRAGDETAFAELVNRYYAPMLRVARAYVATNEAAEDVVQEAWLGLIKGLGRFEGRSSLKTWLFRIVINRAMTRGAREARTVPFSSLGPDVPSVDSSQFNQTGRWAGWWLRENSVTDLPERVVLAKETRGIIDTVISALPANQRLVISLRDVQGVSSEDTCELLGVSEANQRVLLHRARTRVRAALEQYAGEQVGAEP